MDKYQRISRVVISVEGYDTCLQEDDLKKELINHFNSCGQVFNVIVPKDPDNSPNLDRRAFVILLGDGAEEKAMQLNGTDFGGWTALIKVVPDLHEEIALYRSSLAEELMYDPRFWYGVSVRGYDTSLPVDQVESALRKHFSHCGEITHVFVNTLDERACVYFSNQQEESKALNLSGSQVGGFSLAISLAATVRSNRPLGTGQIGHGYCIPAHMIEFAGEIQDKVTAFRKQRRGF